ncbi:MAG: hypothetical protein KDA28_17090, partial [Phycisphaerales bacterium]|nr:hypothetical protein [Phycisphaerales bacterium]
MDAYKLRPALYYPYIHVRDERWLKSTLLTVGSVRRIVPEDFEVHDLDEIRPYAEVTGPDDHPLLDIEHPHSYEVYIAQKEISDAIGSHEPLLRNLTRETAAREFESDQSFQIHRAKAFELIGFLEERELAWPCERRVTHPEDWVCVHPVLGEAIMTQTAIAIAETKGLDAVTTSWRVHRATSSTATGALMRSILEAAEAPKDEAPDPAATLSQMVMETTFDLDALSASDIASILRDSPPLTDFLARLRGMTEDLPPIADDAELRRRLTPKVAEVRDEWERWKRGTWWDAARSLTDVANYRSPEAVSTLLGASSIALVGVGTGL